MDEEAESVLEIRENIEITEKTEELSWSKYLSLTTALIAVVAAIASLLSGSYSNEAVLKKNDAILFQTKASDQYNYYEAKGIKKNIADGFYQQFKGAEFKAQATRYSNEQASIQTDAKNFETQVEASNAVSDHLLEKHHKVAFSVTFFQIAIAMSALSALMRRRSLFFFSLLFAVAGVGYLIWGFVL
jgi:hypothetical protein